MLVYGRYAQWRSRFLRYIDTRPNGDALRKCILEAETILNMSPENKAYFESEKEAIHLILTGIGDEIYSTVDACLTAHEMWEAIERLQQVNVQFLPQLQPEWLRFVTIVKQQHKLDEVSYHKFFDILKQYQKEVNEIRAERISKNANPLALVATAQPHQDPYYQTPKHKGKEIAKPITPPSESASKEDRVTEICLAIVRITILGQPIFKQEKQNQNNLGNNQVLHERPPGALPSNTEPNPREQVNSIMTRSGLTTAKPSFPPHIPPTPRVEVEKEPKTLMDEIHFDISLIDALTQIPKFTKVLKDLLKYKEKLEELANTPINTECSAILFNKVPKKLDDPGKFLIPCILQDLEVYNSLANSGASINLMPLSIYEKLGIGPLKPTRMTLELANQSVTFPTGIAEDVIVKVEKFNFLADFVIVDFEADLRVPIILGKPFLSTARALVDLNNSRDIHSVNCINIIDFSKDKTISGNPTSSSDSMIESLSAYHILCWDSDHLLEETNTLLSLLDNSLPEYETFSFDIEDWQYHYYLAFSLMNMIRYLWIFSINPFPPTDRSAFYHEEFVDGLAHIISPPEYDYFYFDLEADLGEFTNVLEKNIFDLSTNDFTSIELNNSPLLLYDCDSSLSKEFSEIDLLVLFPLGNEDMSDPLFLTDFPEIDTLTSFPSGNER
ncbi:reverse transcriptase domain-containing protein [Tanacetum coccineum]